MDRQAWIRWNEGSVCSVRAFPLLCSKRTLQWLGELERSSAAVVLPACPYLKKKKKSREGEKKKIFTCYQKISMLPYLKLKENCCSVWGEKREVVKVASPQPDVSSNT